MKMFSIKGAIRAQEMAVTMQEADEMFEISCSMCRYGTCSACPVRAAHETNVFIYRIKDAMDKTMVKRRRSNGGIEWTVTI